jgi:N4-gp56 family major capsid protein
VGNSQYYDLTDPETVQKWERELMVQIAMRTPLMSKRYGFIGEGPDSLVQKRKRVWDSEEGGGSGTQATVTLKRELRGEPTFGNTPLRDREETFDTATFKWQINQIRHAAKITGRVTQKRVTWNIWKESKDSLGIYLAKVMEAGAMLHAAGVPYDLRTQAEWYHNGASLGFTLSNTPTVPDTKHIYRINNTADTDDTNVGSDPSAIIDLDVISTLKAIAKNLPIPMRPATINGRELYVLFAHSYSLRHMKSNSQWMEVMRAAMQGGQVEGHPWWTGALGIWDDVLICENNYVPPGFSATNTRVANARRNIFGGAQMMVLGVSKEYDNQNMFQSDEESWDYGNNKGIAATSFLGLACPRFEVREQGTTEDYGRIVVTSYAQELVTSA